MTIDQLVQRKRLEIDDRFVEQSIQTLCSRVEWMVVTLDDRRRDH